MINEKDTMDDSGLTIVYTGKGKGKRTKTVTKADSPADMNNKY